MKYKNDGSFVAGAPYVAIAFSSSVQSDWRSPLWFQFISGVMNEREALQGFRTNEKIVGDEFSQESRLVERFLISEST